MKRLSTMLMAAIIALSMLAACNTENESVVVPESSGEAQEASTSDISEVGDDNIITDIHQTSLITSSRFIERIAEKEEENVQDYLLDGRVDVVDADGYDHQAVVYICHGSDTYTKPFRDYIDGIAAAYPGGYGEIAGYRNLTRSNEEKSYAKTDIDFVAVQKLTLTGANGKEYEATLVSIDGSEDFTAKEAELYNAFQDAYREEPSTKSEETESAPESSAEQSNSETASSDGKIVVELSNNGQKSISQSSSFQAAEGQVLTLKIESSITGGSVDLFLFDPSNKEQRITIEGNNDTKTISLSEGTWAYNCTGLFDSGDIKITGTIE